ncbi:hypothetical protein JOB18_040972 [Solea senegalensis]|uniref:Uncharacterized protein n=1 Tax=Solea senegalensis TaxID=28829 RepID=A0AAV6R5J0_SOLSE|nr:hypothetical protein JOB18_040972 [Solea senegalensis]
MKVVQRRLSNETQQVCFQISKFATIITFDSRKRSKTAEGKPHSADIRKSSSPEFLSFLVSLGKCQANNQSATHSHSELTVEPQGTRKPSACLSERHTGIE